MKGQDYAELLDSYVLFICKSDPFLDEGEKGFGLPCYTFKNVCLENGEVPLDDKSTKVLYNASAYKAVEDEKIRDFLHFVSTNEPAVNEFSQTLSDTVAKLKDNEKFRKDYAAMNLHDRDIKKAAREEGALQKAIDAAINMLKKKYPLNDISEITGLTPEKVLELQEQLTVKM